MRCDNCGVDKTITVTWAIALTRVNPRNGHVTVENRQRRLCVPCGAGLAPGEDQP